MKKLQKISCKVRNAVRSGVGLVALLGVTFGGVSDEPREQRYSVCAPKVVQYQELPLVFASGKYNISQVRQGDGVVPRISVDSFPARHAIVPTAREKKETFLTTMLPMILQANEKVLKDRQRYLDIMSGKGPLSESDQAWLSKLSRQYKVDFRNSHAMLLRLDAVPASLALGQSAAESGWGLSGIAAKKNSPFGHRTKVRSRYTLKTFPSLNEAIQAYILNINTHPAYAQLRGLRFKLRSRGLADGLQLAVGLTKYSELGMAYVQKVQQIIRQNNLTQFDGARLDSESS